MRIGRGRGLEIGHRGRSLHEGGTEIESGRGGINPEDPGAGREPHFEETITAGGSGREIAGGGMRVQGDDDLFTSLFPLSDIRDCCIQTWYTCMESLRVRDFLSTGDFERRTSSA